MKIVVEKYGGTSVGSIERIKAVAKRVVETQEKGYAVVVVVSAMGKTTDELLNMVGEIAPKPRERELGMLLSTGEVVSCSLLALAIQAMGKKATSLTGPQGGITTNGIHDNARIADINTRRIRELLEKGEIVVVAGYQGRNGDDDITVLGRGGSDASAVALAAALEASYCHIFTDVNGVFTADPRIVTDAALLQGISYEEMIELAGSGAQVMMGRAVEIARNFNLKIKVSSSYEENYGTIITKENELEKVVITGVAANKNVAMIDILGLGVDFRESAAILGQMKEQEINIILLSSTLSSDSKTNLSLLIKPEEIGKVTQILDTSKLSGKIVNYVVNQDVAQISIVGSGIATNYGVAFDMFDVLAQNDIKIVMTSTSEIKITAIIPKEKAELALQKLHERFELSKLERSYQGNGILN